MTAHTKLRKEITAWLESQGAWVHTAHMSGYGRKGIPDLLVCYKGKFHAIEVKCGNDTLTPWQKRELRAVEKAQGFAIVARSLHDVLYHLNFQSTAIAFAADVS